jgi:hypothetical protein
MRNKKQKLKNEEGLTEPVSRDREIGGGVGERERRRRGGEDDGSGGVLFFHSSFIFILMFPFIFLFFLSLLW